MSRRGSRVLVAGLLGTTLAVSALSAALLVATWGDPLPFTPFGFRGFDIVMASVLGAVGALVAVRRPENAIGWLFLASGLLSSLQGAAAEYVAYAHASGTPATARAVVAAWFTDWSWVPLTTLLGTFLFLTFPTGRLLGPRWRPLAGLTIVVSAVDSVAIALGPGQLDEVVAISNPYGVPALAGPLTLAEHLGLTAHALCMAAAAASMVVRFRRSRGVERLQLKWFAAAAAFLAAGIVAIVPWSSASPGTGSGWRRYRRRASSPSPSLPGSPSSATACTTSTSSSAGPSSTAG